MRPLLAVLLVAVVAVAAPVPKKVKAKLPDYYPLADGTEWVYAMGESEVTVRVTEFTEKDGVKTGKLVTSIGGKDVASETIRVDQEGVSRTHMNSTNIDPPVLLFKFGLADDESWEVKSKVGESKVKGKLTLKGVDKLSVPAGGYDAVLVSGKMTLSGTAVETNWWLAEGVGIVKLEYTIGESASPSLELKKYTPGKKEK